MEPAPGCRSPSRTPPATGAPSDPQWTVIRPSAPRWNRHPTVPTATHAPPPFEASFTQPPHEPALANVTAPSDQPRETGWKRSLYIPQVDLRSCSPTCVSILSPLTPPVNPRLSQVANNRPTKIIVWKCGSEGRHDHSRALVWCYRHRQTAAAWVPLGLRVAPAMESSSPIVLTAATLVSWASRVPRRQTW